jgi:hypothetical protein
VDKIVSSEMKNLQKLSIQLFFSSSLREEYKKDVQKLLNNKGIPLKYKDFLPNIEEASFFSESYGRKFLITREIFKRYKNFFKVYFKKENILINDVVGSKLLDDYFKSEIFFGHKIAFPHYSGLGKGYENSSKFFFFLVDSFREEDNLMIEAFTSIACHLNYQASFSNILFFKNFEKGVIFSIKKRFFVVVDGYRLEISFEKLPSEFVSLNRVIENIYKEAK